MTVRHLTQVEADSLIAMEKIRRDDAVHDYPDLGGKLAIPLLSVDGTESFFLDRWAVPVPKAPFSDLRNPHRTLRNFLLFCNVVNPPIFQRGLFA